MSTAGIQRGVPGTFVYLINDDSTVSVRPVKLGVTDCNRVEVLSGLQPGDRIVSIADHDVDTWSRFFIGIGARANRETKVEIERSGVRIVKTLTPVPQSAQSRFEIGDLGVWPNVHPHLLQISPGEPGERAGLQTGDVVLAVNSEPITFSSQLRDAIAKHPEQAITLTILRNEQAQDIVVTPARVKLRRKSSFGVSCSLRSSRSVTSGAAAGP